MLYYTHSSDFSISIWRTTANADTMKRVAFTNFCCKVNLAEIDSMIIRLADYGA